MFSKKRKICTEKPSEKYFSDDESCTVVEPVSIEEEMQTELKDGSELDVKQPDITHHDDMVISKGKSGRGELFNGLDDESSGHNTSSLCPSSPPVEILSSVTQLPGTGTLLHDEPSKHDELTLLTEVKMTSFAAEVAETIFVNSRKEGTDKFQDDKEQSKPQGNDYAEEEKDQKKVDKEENNDIIPKNPDIEDGLAHQSNISEFDMSDLPPDSEGGNNGSLRVLCCEKMFLVMAASTAAIGGIMFGYDVGVISGALLQLRQEFHLSCNQQAILVSFLLLGATIGACVSGFLVDLLGRKMTILLNGIIFTLGSITLAVANTFYIVVGGRLLLGCAVSISAVAECIYISEIAPAKRRGLLVSLNELGITLGLLISYLVNFLFINVDHGWRYMFGIAAFPAVFQVVAMFFLPKSPRFLLMKGKERQAARILERLHGETLKKVQLDSIKMSLLKEKRFKFKDLFLPNYNMRGRLILGFGLAFFQQFTGQPNILYYAPVVFQAVGFPSDSAAELATLGLGTVKVTAAVLSLLCVDYWGRRTFLMIGSVAMTISLLLLSIGAQIQEKNFPGHKMCTSWERQTTPPPTPTMTVNIDHLHKSITNNSYHQYNSFSSVRHKRSVYSSFVQIAHVNNQFCDSEIVRNVRSVKGLHNKTLDIGFQNGSTIEPLRNSTGKSEESVAFHFIHVMTMLSLMTYVGAYGISFGPITWIILSEIYPPAIRGRAVALVTVVNWAANFIVSSLFLHLISLFTLPGTFFLFTGMSILSVIFVFFHIPETKNKSLEQISKELSSTKSSECMSQLKHCCLISTHFNSTSQNPYSIVSTEEHLSPSHQSAAI